MKKSIYIVFFSLIIATLVFQSCKKELKADYVDATPDLSLKADYSMPKNLLLRTEAWSVLDYEALVPAENKITNAGATLGRVLFYDKKLSLNNTVACGSCHIQKFAFTDGLATSKGFDGGSTTRNSPAIINVVAQKAFFWDGRADKLETMVLMPVRNHIEMGIDKIENLAKKISAIPYYPSLFESAFGSSEVTKERISKALSQFLRSMVTHNSLFDQNILSSSENAGKNLFFWGVGCANCHNGENFNLKGSGSSTSSDFANIGLDEVSIDKGMGETDPLHDGRFKIPSLRNVSMTAPYMHDGRFKTLEEVVEHYNSGVKNHKNLDPLLRVSWNQSSSTVKLNLTAVQKADLVAFLKTLTDLRLVNDPRFSDPFIK